MLGLPSEELLILFQVRVFNMSRLSGRRPREISLEPTAVYQCHSRRVKKLAVSYHTDGPLFVIWNSRSWGKFMHSCMDLSKLKIWKTFYSLLGEQLTSCNWILYHLDVLSISLYLDIDVLYVMSCHLRCVLLIHGLAFFAFVSLCLVQSLILLFVCQM